MYMDDKESRGEQFEALLNAYPDISVQRDRLGALDIRKQVTPSLALDVSVLVQEKTQKSPSPVIVLSAVKSIEGESLSPFDVQRTFVLITRPEGKELEAEVEFPRSEEKRIDYTEILRIAKQGLEIFNAFKQLPAQQDIMRHGQRVFDFMNEEDTGIEALNARLANHFLGGNNPEQFFDHRSALGQTKMVSMVLNSASTLRISKIIERSS
jgi:hypothetical protein